MQQCDANMQLFHCAEGFASADATRGKWKQTKSAVAPLTPSPAASHVTWFLSLQGKTRRTQTKKFTLKVKYGSVHPKVSKGRSESTLFASAEAKPLRMRAKSSLEKSSKTAKTQHHTSGDAVSVATSSTTYTAAPSMLVFPSSSVKNKYSA